jgi:hypothetical protein
MTGWGRGVCGAQATAGGLRGGWGRGRGLGPGGGGGGWRQRVRGAGGRGWWGGWWPPPAPEIAGRALETEREELERRATILELELEAVRRRCDEMAAAGADTAGASEQRAPLGDEP